MRRIGSVATGSMGLALALAASASAFEGVIEWRDVSVPRPSLAKLTEQAADASSILAIAADRILAQCQSLECRVERTTIYVKGKKMRVEGDVGTEKGEYLIADLDQGRFWMVFPAKKRYLEWTRADAQALQRKAKEMKKMLSQQLKGMNLPPEQMRQIEAATGKAKPRPRPSLRPLDEKATVNGFAAQGYQIEAGQEVTRGWVTRDLGELTEVVKTWTEGMREVAREEEREDPVEALLLERGLPVRVQTMGADEYDVEDLLSVTQRPVEDTMFSEPSRFRKATMEGMTRGTTHGPAQR